MKDDLDLAPAAAPAVAAPPGPDRPVPPGTMADAIAAKDWSATSLGPREEWPAELKCVVDLMLDTKFPHFVAWGPDLALIYNDAYAEIIAETGGALGAAMQVYWADAWATVGPIARAAMAGVPSFFEDLPIRTPRVGRWRQTWWTFSYSPIRLHDGSVGGMFCTATETTRHKLLEQKLEQGERALRRFTDLIPNFLWESDADGQMFRLNRPMRVYLGLGDRERPLDWTHYVHPDDIAHIAAANAEALARQDRYESQHRLRAADGSYRWFIARAQPIFDDQGEMAGWYGCATDIHNWRLTVDELRKSESLVRQFAEHAARILWISDLATGAVEYLNAAGRQFWDGEPQRSIRSWDDWFAVIHPSQENVFAHTLDRLRAGETVAGTFRVADGERNYCDLRATLFPILDAGGRVEKFGGIAEVVDQRRRKLVHLVDPDRDGHRLLSAQLWTHGYEVRGFTDVHAFGRVAPALLAGCVVVRAQGEADWVRRALAAAHQQQGRLRAVVMTDRHDDAGHVRDLMKQSAVDVLPHDAGWATVAAAIEEASRDLDQPEAAPVAVRIGDAGQARLAALSAREREILDRLTGGATNKLVALDLGISPRTVEAHRARIFEKLGVSTLAEAVAVTVKAADG